MDDKIRQWVFVLAIVILYIPTVQLATTTVFPRDDTYPMFYKDCYRNGTDEACVLEQQQMETEYRTTMSEGDTYRFILAALLSFVTVALVAFIPMQRTVAYGLFLGGILNILFSLRFNISKSIIGLVLLVLLFVITLIYINKQQKDTATAASRKRP